MALDFKPERNLVGVDDMVMLSQISEKDLLENLKVRYQKGYIYTSIGQVLISINPYKDVGVFTTAQIEKYKSNDPFLIPPHIFSVADEAYRALRSEAESQSIIISGESGSGKTENSKGIMQYIAAVAGSGDKVDRVKSIFLESNPLLESFGNAKTLRNNNSSRFGKYIEIQFDYKGDPEGGKITNYLLEKSRVVYQIPNERNFHVFYQLFAAPEKDQWKLSSPEQFLYLNKSNCYKADGIDDKQWLQMTRHAMTVVGISKNEELNIFKLLAGILHLGNMKFKPAAKDSAVVADKGILATASSLLGVSPESLERALSYRVISSGSGARQSTYQVPQTVGACEYSRDALSKGIYSKLFDWLVRRVNSTMGMQSKGKTIGILDIYGFEIFETNSFEQLCINYCNETLHQIFIDLTLKTEQEEYVREGIQWEPVQYINNKPCVELIQNAPMGILSILDEECLFPKGTDETLLQKLHKSFGAHAHYQQPLDPVGKVKFVIKHYAGTVTYNVEGFLDKNRDTLFNDLLVLCANSQNPLLKELFTTGQAQEVVAKGGKKRPVTAGYQFKTSMQVLLQALYACQPHYIRCIKPNDDKRPLAYTDAKVTEQSKYLGLLENLRVRRAGYCYRQTYEKWISRYYMVSEKTFPKWRGDPKEGCKLIFDELKLPQGECQYGKTKVFIRSPQTLFEVENQRIAALHRIATKIQKVWRAWKIRKVYLDLKREALDIFKGQKERTRQSMARGVVSFFGDFLGLKENKEILDLMKVNGDTKVLFSEMVNKVNRKDKVQERVLLMTEQAIYSMEKLKKPKKGLFFVLKRRVLIRNISSISLSKLADNYFVIHIPQEYDYVYETPKKTIFITLFNNEYKKLAGKALEVKLVDSIAYKLKSGKKEKTITFQKDEAAHVGVLKKVKGQPIVSVASGVQQ